MKISVLILEDNPITARDLAEILDEHGMNVLEIVYSAEDAIEFLENESPDIMLIDIKLKGEMTGIEFIETIQKSRNIPFIYLTANSDQETVKQAISTNPSSFLTKPFEEKDVIIAIELAFSKIQNQSREIRANKPLFVKNGNRFEKVKAEDIKYLEAEGSYCKIITKDKEYLLSGNLNNVSSQLNHNFVRIHRSFVVNMESITSIDADHVFVDEKTLPVGRSHKGELKKVLLKFS